MQDSTAGIKVYLREGDCPALSEGDRVRVTGQLWDYYNEREIRVAGPEDIQRLGDGEPLKPTLIKTGEVDEAHEGLLVQIVGESQAGQKVPFTWTTAVERRKSTSRKPRASSGPGLRKANSTASLASSASTRTSTSCCRVTRATSPSGRGCCPPPVATGRRARTRG